MKYILVIVGVLLVLAILYTLLNRHSKNNKVNIEDTESIDIEPESSNLLDSDLDREDSDFIFEIEDVYLLKGQGVIALGIVESGRVTPGQEIEIVGFTDLIIKTRVLKIDKEDMGLKEEGIKGEKLALLLDEDIQLGDLEKGQLIVSPNSLRASNEFKGQIELESKDESVDFNLKNKSEIYLRFGKRDIKTEISLVDGQEFLELNKLTDVVLKTEIPMAIVPNSEFYIGSENSISINIKILELIKN